MLLSPLTWGTDFSPPSSSASFSRGASDSQEKRKQRKASQARQQSSEPEFAVSTKRLIAAHPPPSPLKNPLKNPNGKLCRYLKKLCRWESFPEDVDVGIGVNGQGGQLPASRAERKRQQLENFFAFIIPFLFIPVRQSCERVVVVDFCCGCGHQSIPLAFLFPDVNFVLIDAKKRSLDVARGRAHRLGLSNVEFVEGDINCFDKGFDVGISLHACGVATDIAIQKSIKARAVYVSIPCCIGKLAHNESGHSNKCYGLTYPRSKEYINQNCTFKEYVQVAKAADFGHHGYDRKEEKASTKKKCLSGLRRQAKTVIEHDRNLYASNNDYSVYMSLCFPPTCTPKNDILVGIPCEERQWVSGFEDWQL